MIHRAVELVNDPKYHDRELTVRCSVTAGPRRGSRGGSKTLYPIRTPGGRNDEDAFLSIWHENPEWSDAIGETATSVRNVLSDIPLHPGEDVVARGIPNRHEGKWYFNIGDVLIRDPETTIGKSEMRKASECPRIYNLAFEKNVYSPGRYDLSEGAIKGRIAHSLVERAVDDPDYRTNFETGWSESDIAASLEELIENEYAIELGLCRLAWVSTNRITEHSRNAVYPLLLDEQFTDMIASAEKVKAEVQLSESLGFNGRVDLLVDGVPVDLKTTFQLTDNKRQKHRFQLRIYLLALLLESLEPGERIDDRLAEGVAGVLVYPNVEAESEVLFDRVELDRNHIEAILHLRNEAATLRDPFGVPTTYGRDCEGCSFKSPTSIGGGEGNGDAGHLPPPCQFYCQSERRWPCLETVESGEVISQCPLFEECEQRLDFRDPNVTDHYNQLRSALNSERDARQQLGTELDRLDDTTLTRAGLRIPGLKLQSLQGRRRLVFTSEAAVVPAFAPGRRVRLAQTGTEYYETATYYGRVGDRYVFQLSAQPVEAFLNPEVTFEATQTMSTAEYPRTLLGQLDYAQRAEVVPLLETGGTAGDAIAELAPDTPEAVTEHVSNKEVYIDIPVRTNRSDFIGELVRALVTTDYPHPSEPKGTVPESDQRVLVLCESPQVTDRIEELLGGKSGVARMDGFAGEASTAVMPDEGGHEVYTTLRDSSVLLSSLRYALADNVFHSMRSGDPDARQHSTRFFDAVILVGAETLAEPQFHFLQVLGDRIVAIGDTRRHGPELVSGEARESRLGEAYFNRLYRRFANIESESSQSVRVPAVMTTQIADAFTDLETPLTSVDGTVEFVRVDGTTDAAVAETTMTHHVDQSESEGEARFIRLSPEATVDAVQISHHLEQLRTLDASELTIHDTYTIQDIQYEVLTNNPIDGDKHRLEVNVPVEATPYLHRRVTRNEAEAEKVAETCADRDVDVVVTPFVAHANAIRDRLGDADTDVPVRLPEQLTGEQTGTVIVSLAVSGADRIVRSPVSDIETLYTLLNAGRTIVLVGDRDTLERNSVLGTVIEKAEGT